MLFWHGSPHHGGVSFDARENQSRACRNRSPEAHLRSIIRGDDLSIITFELILQELSIALRVFQSSVKTIGQF